MTMVVVEKYSFPEFLDTVVRRGITVLMYVFLTLDLSDTVLISRLSPL